VCILADTFVFCLSVKCDSVASSKQHKIFALKVTSPNSHVKLNLCFRYCDVA
jgi:hypothetical protein